MLRLSITVFVVLTLSFDSPAFADMIFSISAPYYVNLFYRKSSLVTTVFFNDNDRIMDAGQEAEIIVQVSNFGAGKAYDVTGYISGEIPDNLIVQRKAYIGHIESGKSKLISFNLKAKEDITEVIIPLQLAITEKFGRFPAITTINLSCRSGNSPYIPEPTTIKTTDHSFSLENDIQSTGAVNPYAFAVLIGNQDYEPSTYGICHYAFNDVKTLKEYLIQTFGYNPDHIFSYRNATYKNFCEMFGDVKSQGELMHSTKPDTSDVFIYYSGFSVITADTGLPYILPVDCGYGDESVAEKGYPLHLLIEKLAVIQARSVTIVFESAFMGEADSTGTITDIYDIIDIPDNTVIFAASSYGETANRCHESMHGLFTHIFLKSVQTLIDQNSSSISAGMLFSQLTDKESGVPYFAGHIFNGEQQHPGFKGNSDFILLEVK